MKLQLQHRQENTRCHLQGDKDLNKKDEDVMYAVKKVHTADRCLYRAKGQMHVPHFRSADDRYHDAEKACSHLRCVCSCMLRDEYSDLEDFIAQCNGTGGGL